MKDKGFTLIELLVVISIISLLSSVVLASLGEARHKAQISKFKQEFYHLITAVELYKTNHNGTYPTSLSDWGNVNNTIALLESEGLFGSNSIEMPKGFGTFISWDIVNGADNVACGSATSIDGKWALGFDAPEDFGFPQLYAGGGPIGGYYCIEI